MTKTNTTEVKTRSRWGWGIAALYGGFVLFILVIVGYASMQRFDLVDRDYYDRGLAYEDQLQRINRTRALPDQPRYEYSGASNEIVLHFPKSFSPDAVSGTITLFRPSTAALDFAVPLKLDTDLTQRLANPKLVGGLWRAKLAWAAGGKEYYDEQVILVE